MNPIESQFDRILPNDISSEQALLGSLAICQREDQSLAFTTTASILTQDDFFSADHQVIYRVLVDMFRRGVKTDILTLCDELTKRDLLTEVGGRDYVCQILKCIPSWRHFENYANIVKEKAKLRNLIAIGNSLTQHAYQTAGQPANEMATAGLAKLTKLLASGSQTAYRPLGEIMVDVLQQLEQGAIPTVPTGFIGLDAQIGGIRLGEMIVMAARPSMGKSLCAKQIGIASALSGVPTGLISLEENCLKIGRNLLAMKSGVDNRRLRTGDIAPHEWARLTDGTAQLSGIPFFVSEKARRLTDIKAVIASWIARHGVKLVIIDYIQRIRDVPGRSAYETTSAISLEVSDLAKDNNIGLLALAQLNRGVENRDDKRPNMSDLRDSGQIEQDADGIIFIHREDYYHLDEPSYTPTGDVELIISKWRDSARGKIVKLKSNLRHQQFDEPEEQHPGLEDIP